MSTGMPQPMKKLFVGPQQRHTHPLVWLAAIVSTVIAVAVIIAGLVISLAYLTIKPKVPYMRVTYAHLDLFDYGQNGEFNARITLYITATNENGKAHASFSDISFLLRLDGMSLAELRAEPFNVPKNSTITLQYDVQTAASVLAADAANEVEASLSRDRISFQLKGKTRTRWKVGIFGSLKFQKRLSCYIHFVLSNGSSIDPLCRPRPS